MGGFFLREDSNADEQLVMNTKANAAFGAVTWNAVR
jgi:hypothetical protein